MATRKKKNRARSAKPRATNTNGTNNRACAECERLKQSLKRLKAARARDRRLIAELEKDRDGYRDAVYGFLHKEFPYREEDWKDFRLEDYSIPLRQMIEEMERELSK